MKSFNLFKNEKEKDAQPDYSISARQDDGDYVTVGACWVKEREGGDKFLSCKLQDAYKDRPGFTLAVEEESETKVKEDVMDAF